MATLRILTDTVTTVITWATLDTTAITCPTPTTATARGPPRPSLLLRLMPRLPPRLTPGCTTATLATDSTHTATVTTATTSATPPMPDTTHTPTTEAAEMATEPWFPAPGNSVEVSALVLLK